MIHPYEFSRSWRSFCVAITHLLQWLRTLCWVILFCAWIGSSGYFFLNYLRTLFEPGRKPFFDWWQEKITAHAAILEQMLLGTIALIVLIFLLASCCKLLKYSKGAWIEASGDLCFAGGIAYLGWLYHQKALPLSKTAMLSLCLFIGITVVWGLIQSFWCRRGRIQAERLIAQAKEAFEKQEFSACQILLEDAVRYSPYNLDALYLLAETEYNLKHTDQALAIYRLGYEIGKLYALGNDETEKLWQQIRKRIETIEKEARE